MFVHCILLFIYLNFKQIQLENNKIMSRIELSEVELVNVTTSYLVLCDLHNNSQ